MAGLLHGDDMYTERSMALRREREGLITQARALLDRVEGEKRDFDGAEKDQYAALDTQIRSLSDRIKREEDAADIETEARAAIDRPTTATGGSGARTPTDEQRALRSFFNPDRRGDASLSLVGGHEARALQGDSDTAGGFTIDPQSFVAQLIKFVDDQVFIRQRATVIPVMSADSLGAPSLDADLADSDWTVELDTGTDDTAMVFGKRELRPHPLAKGIKVSRKLLRASALPVEQLVRERMGYKVGVTQEKGFLTGSGAGQPLGVFTASANGISTSRDVSTGNAGTEIGADGLIRCKGSLKGQYQSRARWLFHRDAVTQLALLKDGDGQYLWRSGLMGGQPDMLLGLGMDMSEFAPNTFTTGQYVGILAVWEFYWIADAMSMEIQRLDELYARTNQVGFVSRMEVDGMPVLEEAFARVKLG